MKRDPKIYLVLDNCFAIKRWVRPILWMEAAKDIGFKYVSASTDNEIDPLFSTSEYMDEWFKELTVASEKTGIIVPTLYTGYQTYRTVGLAHFDEKMAHHLKENWIMNLVDRASKAGIKGLGFCFHAFSEEIMQSYDEFSRMEERYLSIMAEVGDFAGERDFQVSIEQMYVPYQTPFTIAQSEYYLRRIYSMTDGHPIYLTLDTGHMIGQ
jgi:sugar phosphate isomerase/epimerase